MKTTYWKAVKGKWGEGRSRLETATKTLNGPPSWDSHLPTGGREVKLLSTGEGEPTEGKKKVDL